MRSKTSFFDRAIFLRELKQTAPLWALYLLVLLFLPIDLLASFDPGLEFKAEYLCGRIQDFARAISTFGAFFYGALLAWVLQFSLFQPKASNFYAALPIRREALFTTRYLTGLLLGIVPQLLLSLLALAFTAALGSAQPRACLDCFLSCCLSFVFFYSLATLCCTVCGKAVMPPILYIILNFVVIVVELIVRVLLECFVYGFCASGGYFLSAFSPLVYLLRHFVVCAAGAAVVADWSYLVLLAAVGILFAVLALLFFRRREMERSGDMIAVRWLRPVFQYAFTLGCALVFCQVVKSLISIPSFSTNFIVVMALLLAGALLGHSAARMLLTKSIHVFRRGWGSFFICCAVLAVGFGTMRFDFFGYSSYVPDASDIRRVSLQTYAGQAYPLGDENSIEQVLALHRRCVEERETLTKMEGSSIYFIYELQNGKLVTRRFAVPTGPTEPGTFEDDFDHVYNSLPFILTRLLPDVPVNEQTMASCTIVYNSYADKYSEPNAPIGAVPTTEASTAKAPQQYTTLGSREAWAFYTSCVLPDLADSSLGKSAFPTYRAGHETAGYSCDLYFDCYNSDGSGTVSFSLALTTDAARTVAYLQELGYPIS